MLKHEKKISEEVFLHRRSIHYLYQGVRLQRIVEELVHIAQKKKERLIIIGANEDIIKKIHKKESNIHTVSEEPEEKNTLFDYFSLINKKQEKRQKKRQKPNSLVTRQIPLSEKARKTMYTNHLCIFVTERVFLIDLLKERVEANDLRIVYIIGESCLKSSKTIREFIMFISKVPISTILTYQKEYSFSEITEQAKVPARGIFLYPFFRASVEKSFEEFFMTEISTPLDSRRRSIQAGLLEIHEKSSKIIDAQRYDGYIWWIKRAMRTSIFLLFNENISNFLTYFIEISSIKHNIEVLSNFYGHIECVPENETKYMPITTWIYHETIEEIIEIAKVIKEKEKEFPKKKLIKSLIAEHKKEKKSISILTECSQLDTYTDLSIPVYDVNSLNTSIREISIHPNPCIILSNYSVAILRKLQRIHKKWKSKGVEIHVLLITVKNSAEELLLYEDQENEINKFKSAIELKRNRPSEIDYKKWKSRPDNPTAPLLSIDLRELRSSLPLSLCKEFSGQFLFNFSTLPQGDYILNKAHYIERKSLPDLISSIRTGRLFKQLESILYIRGEAYLLIEFPEHEKLSILNYLNTRKLEINLIYHIISLLSTMKNINIFFSNSDHLSNMLISSLARKPSSPANPQTIDPQIIECLIYIPGISHANLNIILKNFSSLHDLINSEKKRLIAVLGEQIAEKVFKFFNE
ncbi:hypothetical protein NEFER03_2081 [Nematocida sp. LUAm3]|nr:hypothetical protein NEFER03_2081 [Nematocida sp. LUAm3]KAI5176201.1 hypothetical protein NEFER02_2007 [Nematocida sp. LUAm2]KAI5179189.1 hypothetical protein NEFER01_2046 [Nematocida sp. LUAm1]